MVVRKQPRSMWIGSPLGSNKPINFFKSNSKDLPVNMFKDNDGDGVANVFDCQPNNKNKQGLIDAMVGGVKGLFTKGGSAKQGWREGMAREGNPVSRRYRAARQAQAERRNRRLDTMSPQQDSAMQQAEIVRRLRGTQGIPIHERFRKRVVSISRNIAGTAGLPTNFTELQNSIRRANPNYTHNLIRTIAENQVAMSNPNISSADKKRLLQQNRMLRAEKELSKVSRVDRSEKEKIAKLALQATFPMIGQIKSGKHVMGVPGQRGRPRGSLDPRYAQYGGVFQYRKAMSAQRRAFRQQLQQQQALMKQQRVPQYEQQQYQQSYPQEQQLPPELQGQNITPEYSQMQQEQPQMQEQVPQYQQSQPNFKMQQQSSLREIKPVFKSSGGSPYPAVDRTPLAPPKQTVPQGYVETVDSFTGRRFIKQLPRAESWVR